MKTSLPEASKGKPANRLINESSTYLLQHAHNPVNWQAWNNQALEEALKRNKPILLSIGYSACHWCHVMEEESFQDDATAKIINENFIPIKVDREERPDIDDIYMTAVQLMTGHGGWPLTVFLTPQQKPFYGGTYFPKEDKNYGQHVLPGFKTILNAVSDAWENERDKAESSANKMTHAIVSMTQHRTISKSQNSFSKNDLLLECAIKLLPYFDLEWGGFAGAPKFPQTLSLQLCLQAAAKYKQNGDEDKSNSLMDAVRTSLDGMARGGIYDHLAGGFARYSTDEKWLVPHFEKMLYDNALLVDIYLDAYAFTGKRSWLEVATQTLDFINSELTSPQGGLYSALDADSEGVEGKFYVWKKTEIQQVLGHDAELFCQIFGVSEKGNFESAENVLFLSKDKSVPDVTALKAKLLAHRAKRIRPITDEKILTSWSSLAISAFVGGYRITGEDKYLIQARQTANFILNNLNVDGRIKRCFAKEQAKIPGYLDDYAFYIRALIDLASVDSNPIWLEHALALTDNMLKHFFVEGENDFFYTADDQEKLITRPKSNNDGPLPSATSIAISNLLKLEILTDNRTYRQYAESVLNKQQNSLHSHPTQYASMITAWDFAHSDPVTLILVGCGDPNKDKEFLLAIHNIYHPNKIVVVKHSTQDFDQRLTLLSQKHLLNKQPTVYICQGQTCYPPINDVDKVKIMLKNN